MALPAYLQGVPRELENTRVLEDEDHDETNIDAQGSVFDSPNQVPAYLHFAQQQEQVSATRESNSLPAYLNFVPQQTSEPTPSVPAYLRFSSETNAQTHLNTVPERHVESNSVPSYLSFAQEPPASDIPLYARSSLPQPNQNYQSFSMEPPNFYNQNPASYNNEPVPSRSYLNFTNQTTDAQYSPTYLGGASSHYASNTAVNSNYQSSVPEAQSEPIPAYLSFMYAVDIQQQEPEEDLQNSGLYRSDGFSRSMEDPLTMDLFEDPMLTSCGHRYDRESITSWLNTGNNTCPLCRARISKRTLKVDHEMRRRLGLPEITEEPPRPSNPRPSNPRPPSSTISQSSSNRNRNRDRERERSCTIS